jgi:hypothetical protein
VTYITFLYTVINNHNKNDRSIYVWRGHAVMQVVEALRYKQEGRGFSSFRPHYGPGIDSASNRNGYQEYQRVKAAGE